MIYSIWWAIQLGYPHSRNHGNGKWPDRDNNIHCHGSITLRLPHFPPECFCRFPWTISTVVNSYSSCRCQHHSDQSYNAPHTFGSGNKTVFCAPRSQKSSLRELLGHHLRPAHVDENRVTRPPCVVMCDLHPRPSGRHTTEEPASGVTWISNRKQITIVATIDKNWPLVDGKPLAQTKPRNTKHCLRLTARNYPALGRLWGPSFFLILAPSKKTVQAGGSHPQIRRDFYFLDPWDLIARLQASESLARFLPEGTHLPSTSPFWRFYGKGFQSLHDKHQTSATQEDLQFETFQQSL